MNTDFDYKNLAELDENAGQSAVDEWVTATHARICELMVERAITVEEAADELDIREVDPADDQLEGIGYYVDDDGELTAVASIPSGQGSDLGAWWALEAGPVPTIAEAAQ